jgi:6-phosphogluconolactonase
MPHASREDDRMSDDDRGPIPLAEDPDPPALPGTVRVGATPDATIDAIAADLITQAIACVREFGDFHLALSGGNTPMPLYERLMYDPDFRSLPWRRTHLWIVDERCVPFDDPRSNFGRISEIVVAHSDIPAAQVHPIEATADDAETRYERHLRETLAWREKGHDRLDFVLLGMGDNGHTASLFPHTDVLREEERLVGRCIGPEVEPERITMTYPLLNASRVLCPLVIGAGKAEMIRRVATGDDPVSEIPIKGIRPVGGELRWRRPRRESPPESALRRPHRGAASSPSA